MRNSGKEWDSLIKEKFAERGLISAHQQKNRITDVRNAIKLLDPNHPSLAVVGFTAQEWIEINSMASTESTNRTTQFLDSTDAIAQKANQLLSSRIWSEVAAGLAVVTGRRVSEILKTAHFTFKSTYSVMFTGAVKRRDQAVTLTFEIPTLVPAHTVLDAIATLRGWLDTNNMTNRQINDRYEHAVAQACDRHFRNLVPLRSGKGNLYTHLFRAVYATIAAHWFCPPTVSDLEFRAIIQGHFQILNETNREKRTSMAAQRHYWDYKIADGQGNVDGRLGIKLQETGVQVLEAFERTKTTTTIKEDRGQKVHLRVFSDDRAHLASIQSQFDLNSRADAFHYCLELAQSLLTTAETLNLTPHSLIERLANLDSEAFPNLEPKPELSLEEQLSQELDRDQSPPSTTKGLSESDVNPHHAVDLTTEDTQPMTEELSNSYPSTDPSEQALFAKLDRQQESLSSLTDAIHDLVKVLANSPSSTNPPQHSEGKRMSNPSSDLVQSQPLSQPKIEPPSNLKPSDTTTTKRKRRCELSRQKVNQYIERIMAYNNVQDRLHADKWLITIAALKRLTHCGQSVIYDVLNSRASEIQFHHDKHQLGIYHNQKGKTPPKLNRLFFDGHY